MSLAKDKNATTDTPKLATVPMADVEQELDTSADGLSQAEAQRRLETYGYNELAEETLNPLVLAENSHPNGCCPGMIWNRSCLHGHKAENGQRIPLN
jgi:Cation transporter/ATPase, N-terminus